MLTETSDFTATDFEYLRHGDRGLCSATRNLRVQTTRT